MYQILGHVFEFFKDIPWVKVLHGIKEVIDLINNIIDILSFFLARKAALPPVPTPKHRSNRPKTKYRKRISRNSSRRGRRRQRRKRNSESKKQ